MEVTQHRTERGRPNRPSEREEHPGSPCYPRSGVDSTGQKLRSPLSQLHAWKSAAQINFRMMSGIPGPGVLTGSFPFIGLKGTPAYQPMTGKLWVCQLDRKTQSRVRDTEVHQAPLSMGFSRQGCWRGLSCPPPGDLPDPGIEPVSLSSPALANSLPLVPSGKPCCRLTIP